ncbi:MAG TPA: hypothetical protein VHX60_01515 [Acidobacteriaceae bacterium]|nr:hypothetical protein [Acidobacteriaceae bacterium]
MLLAGCALAIHAQTAAPAADAPPSSTASAPANTAQDTSTEKARAALDAMVQALGGDRWLNLENTYTTGRIAAFYQGKPTGGTVQFWDWKTSTDERLDLDEKMHDRRKWVQIFTPTQCWEITYQGKKPMQKGPMEGNPCDQAIRRRKHSIEVAVKQWMKDPNTVLLYEGQSLAERHLAIQVTLINTDNDSITIQMDATTHLPLRRTYYWRDPEYKDKNEEVEEYDDYHNIDGLPTPFAITRFHNGDMTLQRFVFKAALNAPLPEDGFDADAIAAKIAH